MPTTDDDIKTEIGNLCAKDSWPTLTDADLDTLLVQAKRADRFGRPPSDTAWLPTYAVNFAVRAGWRIKAGRCATATDYKDGQMDVSRAQALDGCLRMVKEYSKTMSSIKTIAPQRPPVPSIVQGYEIPIAPLEGEQGAV